jgi:acetyl-CoA acetyltransferase
VTGFHGATAVVGVGATDYFKRGTSPLSSAQLVLQAILAACDDAGADPRSVHGFVSYAGDSSEGLELAAALGVNEVRWSTQILGGGVQRAGRLRGRLPWTERGHRRAASLQQGTHGHLYAAHGMIAPAQMCAMRTQRMLEVDGIPVSALEAVSLAGYHHAQNNPRAVTYGHPLDLEIYASSRMIAEPLHLYDCSRENDRAAANLVVRAGRVGEYRGTPAYILAGVQGASAGWTESVENEDNYTSAGFHPILLNRLFSRAQIAAADVDVAQVYENFTGPAVASMIDHSLCPPGPEAGESMTVENPTVEKGVLPINTAGGNIAEGFVHGIGLVAAAVRRIRGGSPNPVRAADISLLIGGPVAPLVSSTVFGSPATV